MRFRYLNNLKNNFQNEENVESCDFYDGSVSCVDESFASLTICQFRKQTVETSRNMINQVFITINLNNTNNTVIPVKLEDFQKTGLQISGTNCTNSTTTKPPTSTSPPYTTTRRPHTTTDYYPTYEPTSTAYSTTRRPYTTTSRPSTADYYPTYEPNFPR